MFVSQAKFDEEHRLRTVAEARATEIRQEIAVLRGQLSHAYDMLDQANARNERTQQMFLEHYEPKSEPSAFAKPAELTNRKAGEILVPATSRREMALRSRLYNEALRTERLKTTQSFDQSQTTAPPVEGLNEKEKAHIDTILEGIGKAAQVN